jgi:metallo-beta-lactamase class B
MKYRLLICLVLIVCQVQAQFSVRLILTDIATRKDDDVFVAGSFNNWQPADPAYKLKPSAGGRKVIVLKDVAPGTYAFKFTRGGWDKVECKADGADITDRVIEVNADISQEITIAGWKDDYPIKAKRYTASPQVRIMDTAFQMPQLNRQRRIWIYLPKGYATNSKTYPVLYMHDGQNLFDEQTAPFGEWGVDECLDSLQQQLKKECIVVGIDHGGDKRLTEYNVFDNTRFGKGEGKAYVDFIAKTLKPFIDAKYRTIKGPAGTSIAGSSMGGLISYYAILQYPEVFGSAGVFSPSFWIAPEMKTLTQNFQTTAMPRFYFYAGGREGAQTVSDMDGVIQLLQTKSRYEIRRSITPLAQHNEAAWRAEFPLFYTWLMR